MDNAPAWLGRFSVEKSRFRGYNIYCIFYTKEVVSIKLKIDFFKDDLKLLTVNGQFFPEQMSSRLFMPKEDVANKYQIAFHERFHYLQYIFTPYGHMKWGANRTYSSEILGMVRE